MLAVLSINSRKAFDYFYNPAWRHIKPNIHSLRSVLTVSRFQQSLFHTGQTSACEVYLCGRFMAALDACAQPGAAFEGWGSVLLPPFTLTHRSSQSVPNSTTAPLAASVRSQRHGHFGQPWQSPHHWCLTALTMNTAGQRMESIMMLVFWPLLFLENGSHVVQSSWKEKHCVISVMLLTHLKRMCVLRM